MEGSHKPSIPKSFTRHPAWHSDSYFVHTSWGGVKVGPVQILSKVKQFNPKLMLDFLLGMN